jgi:type IV pilus assembly protein PilV
MLSGKRAQRGAALLEVMVSIMITSFGLLALAGLQTKMNAALLESYQRAQALTLLEDMTQRIQVNQNQSASYVAASLGTGETAVQPVDCATLGTNRALLDRCEWSNALKGAAETAVGGNVGAMVGARGCIEQLQAPNLTAGVCLPAIYRVTVAWQGFNATVVPAVACGAAQFGDDDSLRKIVSSRVIVPLPGCS